VISTHRDDVLRRYIQLRNVGLRLNHKIINRYASGDVIRNAARDLGIKIEKRGGRRLMLFESNAEIHFLMDYIVHDYILRGKRLFELYEEEVGASDEVEAEILAAKKRSYVSLFEVNRKLPFSAQLYLTDLLGNRKIRIIDFGMSLSVSVGTIIGFRLVPHKGFGMTSGTPLPFVGLHRREVMRGFQRIMDKLRLPTESARKYVAIFRLGRKYGITQMVEFSDRLIRGDRYYTTT